MQQVFKSAGNLQYQILGSFCVLIGALSVEQMFLRVYYGAEVFV